MCRTTYPSRQEGVLAPQEQANTKVAMCGSATFRSAAPLLWAATEGQSSNRLFPAGGCCSCQAAFVSYQLAGSCCFQLMVGGMDGTERTVGGVPCMEGAMARKRGEEEGKNESPGLDLSKSPVAAARITMKSFPS